MSRIQVQPRSKPFWSASSHLRVSWDPFSLPNMDYALLNLQERACHVSITHTRVFFQKSWKSSNQERAPSRSARAISEVEQQERMVPTQQQRMVSSYRVQVNSSLPEGRSEEATGRLEETGGRPAWLALLHVSLLLLCRRVCVAVAPCTPPKVHMCCC
jgi:hypothetical protein